MDKDDRRRFVAFLLVVLLLNLVVPILLGALSYCLEFAYIETVIRWFVQLGEELSL